MHEIYDECQGHENHICHIMSTDDASIETVRNLVKDAKYICTGCARVATKPDNLCKPQPLDK